MGLYDRDYMQDRPETKSGSSKGERAAHDVEAGLAAFWARHPRLPLAVAALVLLAIVLTVLAVVFS